MDDETSYFHTRGDELLENLGNHLVHDEVWRARLEARLGEAVSFFVNTYGSELAEVISVTVERWDGKEAAERIELRRSRRQSRRVVRTERRRTRISRATGRTSFRRD